MGPVAAEQTRVRAAGKLAELATGGVLPTNAVPYLVRVLDDPDYGVRYHSVEELGRLGPAAAEAVPRLMELFHATEREWELVEGNSQPCGQFESWHLLSPGLSLAQSPRRARFKAYSAFMKSWRSENPFGRPPTIPLTRIDPPLLT